MARSAALGFLLALLLPAWTASATIILLRDDRQISNGVTTLTPDVPFQDWDANIRGTFAGSQFVEGAAGTEFIFGAGFASDGGFAPFDITFESTTAFELMLMLEFQGFGPLVSEVRIEDDGGALLIPELTNPSGGIQYENQLGPGVYRLLIAVGPSSPTPAGYEFGLRFVPAPIPEPGGALLFGLGAVALLPRLRRR